ncbi:hypothetical protein STEG23_006945, partial [Scotinomys teguina]
MLFAHPLRISKTVKGGKGVLVRVSCPNWTSRTQKKTTANLHEDKRFSSGAEQVQCRCQEYWSND